jgi:hypothetical protein
MGILGYNKPIYLDTPIAVAHRRRVYHFEGDQDLAFENVVFITIMSAGGHRLVLENGDVHIVKPGWLSIDIEEQNGQKFTEGELV